MLLIAASILAARKLATYDAERQVPATVAAIQDAVTWAERIMFAIDKRCRRRRVDGAQRGRSKPSTFWPLRWTGGVHVSLPRTTCFEGAVSYSRPKERTMRSTRPLRQTIYALALAVILFSQPIISQTQASSSASAPTTTHAQPMHGKVNCTSNGTYVNSRGQTVPRPENCSGPPQGATAQCRDGSYSFSRSRRGTCSHHGAVAKWS